MHTRLYKQPFETTVAEVLDTTIGTPQLITGIDHTARAVLIAQLYEQQPQQLLIIEPVATRCAQLYDDLTQLLPNVDVLSFPVEESLAMEFAVASFEQMAQRIEVLEQLATQEPCIVIASVSALRKKLLPLTEWQQLTTTLTAQDELERASFERLLQDFGYHKQAAVQAPGEYSVRGGIIDFYPLNTEYPVRIDLFDTEIDSIRLFDANTQMSLENIDAIKILPVRDVVLPISDQQQLVPLIRQQLERELPAFESETQKIMRERMNENLEQVEHGEPLIHATAYMDLLFEKSATLLDYVATSGHIILMGYDKILQQDAYLDQEDVFWIEQEVYKGDLLPQLKVRDSIRHALKSSHHRKLYVSTLQKGFGNIHFAKVHNFQYRSMNQFFNQMPLIKSEIDHWLKQGMCIQVVVSTEKMMHKTYALFEEYDVKPMVLQADESPVLQAVNITVGQLAQGFELPLDKWVVLTERELFNHMKRRTVKRQALTNAERIKSYNELNVGDFVVHVNHGIGKYTGIDTIELQGIYRDLLAIEYADNARVLIPMDQVHLLQKYVASESKTPKLHKLGNNEWAKTKQKVAAKIEDIADELIALYAKREREVGHAFGPDTPEQAEFERAFSYVETDDQLRSAAEIKADMEKPKPMDRLLVGDVGYGKTEVAMRAIFKAIMDGKQVAFLVPTTILAQQHYNTLVQRFADYPIEIGLLSRFVKKQEQKETAEKLALGQVDIVVGTHRLLSQDVKFQDLGLLIVDEEQRFGVKHKERLKQLKSQVDVLTLTATPIPRTLHMSMIGVRDLSVIETPPNNRFPVQTYVMEWNAGAIKAGIERELSRGGQVFYLYNRVATIEQRATTIRELVPDARVAIAHGQMSEVELETILIDFIQGAYDVLVTTTIIETGVDIPNANTLFVEDADHMGLSTLYQLRGRVGRTNRVAYAYLMYEPFKQLSEVGDKRLSAIREFTELGSGFKIAMRDLSIRGAGNLLGKQQSGFIDSVGFDLYSQMLKEAVDIKRGNVTHTHATNKRTLEWQLSINAYIPKSYIEDERQKIAIYKAIQQVDSEESYRQLQDQLIDRYGEYPSEVADLLEVAMIRHYGIESRIVSIKQTPQLLTVTFDKEKSDSLKGMKIFEAMQTVPLKATVKVEQDQLSVSFSIFKLESYQWLSYLKKFVQWIAENQE